MVAGCSRQTQLQDVWEQEQHARVHAGAEPDGRQHAQPNPPQRKRGVVLDGGGQRGRQPQAQHQMCQQQRRGPERQRGM